MKRFLPIVVLLAAGCGGGTWIDAAFRDRDEAVARAFVDTADAVENGGVSVGRPTADAVNKRLMDPRIDETMNDVRAWLGESKTPEDTARALRTVAESRRRTSRGGDPVFPAAVAGLVGLVVGVVLGRRQTGAK